MLDFKRAASFHILPAGAVFFAAAALAACGGSSTPIAPSPTALPAAVATGCLEPETQAQTVALPAAGGVSGTISLGAFASASSSCIDVTVATGADATLSVGSASAAASVHRPQATTPTPTPAPLTQVELSNTYDGQLTWASVTLQLPPGSVPAGQYPATITTTIVLGDGQTSTSVANFTVTVSSSGKAIVTGPSLAQFLAVVQADTTGLLSIYPAGTVLPSPSPVPLESETPSASPSPTATGSASPSPTATPTPTSSPTIAPTPQPTATPSPGTYTTNVTLTPGNGSCIQLGSNATQLFTVNVATAPPPGTTIYYAWNTNAGGTLTIPGQNFSIPGYEGLPQTAGLQPMATLVTPSFSGSLAGSGGGLSVILYVTIASQPDLGYIEVLDPSGGPAEGEVVLAEGAVTCASEGYALPRAVGASAILRR